MNAAEVAETSAEFQQRMIALTAQENAARITAPLRKFRHNETAERDLKRVEQITGHNLHQAIRAEPGSVIFDAVYGYLGRFVAYPSKHARAAHTLWIVHAHVMDRWDSTPRIAFLSPEPASGKSRALEVTEPLVPRAIQAVNVTPAYLFRKVGSTDGAPTILYDEIDTVFGQRAKENEEIRGLLNAGHRKGAVAGRCVVRGKQVFTEEIPAYCAVALAGLGGLPDTILSRCVVVRMRRRAPGEYVESYRARINRPEGAAIGERLAAWAQAVTGAIHYADMPVGIEDRDADTWEALLAVADAAGGSWPQRARAAAVALVAESKASTPSLGVLLLADLRAVFDAGALATETILDRLHGIEDSPWADLRGKPLDSRALGRLLAKYEIKPGKIRDGDRTFRGYTRAALLDAWARYLPPIPDGSGTSGTRGTTQAGCGLPCSGYVPAVPDAEQLPATQQASSGADCSVVPDVPDKSRDGELEL